MNRSIRNIVLVTLLLGMLLAATITAISCIWLSHKSYMYGLDEQLQSTAHIIKRIPETQLQQTLQAKNRSEPSLQIQIYNNKTNKLIFKTTKMPTQALVNDNLRFTTLTLNDTSIRVFRTNDSKTGRNIIVADTINKHLIRDYLGYSLFYIILSTFIVLGVSSYIVVRNTLKFLPLLSKNLKERASTKLEPINIKHYPREIEPMLIELNKLFSRMQWAFERNKRFSADAAHELRTPLTALKTQAQLALEINDTEEREKALVNVLISVNRCIHAVQQLLTLSRLDHEDELNDVLPVNLETVCAEIIAFLYPHALEKNIEIELDNECSHPIIMGNDASLGILLRNLIDNAIRYTPERGIVNVKLSERGKQIGLQIADTGPGIDTENREKVFDRFFRVLGTKQTGSGLGLAIVKQIVELHRGTIALNAPEDSTGLIVDITFNKP